jgi:hypothetical protein
MSLTSASGATLEDAITAIEQRLAALGLALRDRDARAIELHSQALHQALASAIQRFTHAAREPGGVSPGLRRRLVMAGGQVAAQRESLARATAALDRAIDVLMPTTTGPAAYAAHGGLQRPASGGCIGT